MGLRSGNGLTNILFPHLRGQEQGFTGEGERELLSSTSDEVCELWTGEDVARIKRQLPAGAITPLFIGEGGILMDGTTGLRQYYEVKGAGHEEEEALIHDMLNAAPNLSLNLQGPQNLQRRATWILALLGIALLILSHALAAIITYQWKLQESVSWGYPCFVVGSVLVFGALFGCGLVHDAATVEKTFRFKKEDNQKIAVLWLQYACNVGGRRFPSYAVFQPPNNQDIRVSWREPEGKDHR
jgi:hypothetical protein